jgi:hypothetical protein
MNAFKSVPVANKEDDCADNKQARHVEKPSEMTPFVFDV